jgi:hypothetical protein
MARYFTGTVPVHLYKIPPRSLWDLTPCTVSCGIQVSRVQRPLQREIHNGASASSLCAKPGKLCFTPSVTLPQERTL